MSVPAFQVIHTPTGGSPTNYNKITAIRVTDSRGNKSSTFSFDIINNDNSLADTFNYGDTIEIKLGQSATNLTTVIVGRINSVIHNLSRNRKIIQVKGMDRTAELLDYRIQGKIYKNGIDEAQGSTDLSASNIVKDLIEIYARDHENNVQFTTNHVTDTLPSSEFPASQKPFQRFVINQKTLYETIKELSRKKYTGKGDFQFYIDTSNDLHFEPKPDTVETYEIITKQRAHSKQLEVIEASFERSIKNLINAYIINGGNDLYGNPVLGANYDRTSARKVGRLIWGFKRMTEIMNNIILQAEPVIDSGFEEGVANWTGGGTGTLTITKEENITKIGSYSLKGTISDCDNTSYISVPINGQTLICEHPTNWESAGFSHVKLWWYPTDTESATNTKITIVNNGAESSAVAHSKTGGLSANTWQELIFDISGLSRTNVSELRIYYDLENEGAKTFYLDHVRVSQNKSNQDLRNYGKEIIRARALELAEASGQAKWSGNIKLRGTLRFTPGNKVKIISDSPNWSDGKELRILEVVHEITSRGWITSLKVKEDVGDITW